MSIQLPPDVERLIAAKVASGHYATAVDVICEALVALEDRESARRMAPEELRKEIAIGLEEADRGDSVPFNRQTLGEIRERALSRLEARGAQE